MAQIPTTGCSIGRFTNYGEDMLNIANPQGTVEYRVDGNADVWMTGDFDQFNGLPLVSHGLASQVARFDTPAGGATAAYSNQLLYTTPTAVGGGSTDTNNIYSGFYRVTWSAKVLTPGSVGSVLGGGGGLQLVYTASDDNVVITTPGNAISGNNGNTTSVNGNGVIIMYVASGTQIKFSFGYSTTGTNMAYSLHLRLEDL
jgi:hypothetical protein